MENLEEILDGVRRSVDREIENLEKINSVLNNTHIKKAISELRDVVSASCVDLSPLEKIIKNEL